MLIALPRSSAPTPCSLAPQAALQDRGSVSDSGELDGFGFYAMTVPSTKPRHRARGHLRKLSHYAVDMFGKWAARRPESSVWPTVRAKMQVWRRLQAWRKPLLSARRPVGRPSGRQEASIVGFADSSSENAGFAQAAGRAQAAGKGVRSAKSLRR